MGRLLVFAPGALHPLPHLSYPDTLNVTYLFDANPHPLALFSVPRASSTSKSSPSVRATLHLPYLSLRPYPHHFVNITMIRPFAMILVKRRDTFAPSHFTMFCFFFTIICYASIMALTMTLTYSMGLAVGQNEGEIGRKPIGLVSLIVKNRGMNRGEPMYKRMRELFLHSLRKTGRCSRWLPFRSSCPFVAICCSLLFLSA